MHAIRLSAVLNPSTPTLCRVPLIRALADYEDLHEPGVRGVFGVLDEDPMTSGASGRRWVELIRPSSKPLSPSGPVRARGCGWSWPFHRGGAIRPLGRFRLSVTDRPFPLFQPSLWTIRADVDRDGRTRLGAAYVLLGDWALAVTVLAQAAARPEASVLDDLLLALARHHLGRLDEARSDCARVLERLRNGSSDEATHDAAIEALMTIRGLDADAADSLLLDLVFPAPAVCPVGDGFVRRPARLARARRLCPPTRQSPLANPQSRLVRG